MGSNGSSVSGDSSARTQTLPQQRHHVWGPDEARDDEGDRPGVVAVVAEGPDGGDDHDPHQRDRDQDLPAETHELVVPQPGPVGAQPDEDEKEAPEPEREPQ